MEQKTEPICKLCEDQKQLYTDGDLIDCRCTDDNWNPEYPDACSICHDNGVYVWENMDGTLDDPCECEFCDIAKRP
jgi:hypothetical protein